MPTLCTLVAALALAPAPQEAEFAPRLGMEAGVTYEMRVHRTRHGRDGRVREGTRRILLRLEGDPKFHRTLRAEVDAFDADFTDAATAVGLTRADLLTIVEFELDKSLAIVGVRDWQRLRDLTSAQVDRIVEALARGGQIPPEAAAGIGQGIERVLSTPEGVSAMYARGVRTYFDGYAWKELTVEPRRYASELDSPFGGGPIPGWIEVVVDDDPSTPEIEFRASSGVDPDGLLAFMEDFARSMDAPNRERVREELAGTVFTDEVSWSYDPDAHLIRRAEVVRRTSLGGAPRIAERTTWELVAIERPAPP